jgi:hypothetical protein
MAERSQELIPMFVVAIAVLLAVTCVDAIPIGLVWLNR